MKRRNKLFVLLLSFALAFTMLAMPVYADTETDLVQDETVNEVTPEESENEAAPGGQELVSGETQVKDGETAHVAAEAVSSAENELNAEPAQNGGDVQKAENEKPAAETAESQTEDSESNEAGEKEESAEPEKIAYYEEELNFIKADGSQYGMFTPQDGTTCAVEGDNVVIHYVPKNTTIYAGFNWGSVEKSIYKDDASQPEIEVKANPDGSYDITLSKDNCGYALPVAVVKNSFSKGSWTSADQYYLAVPVVYEEAETKEYNGNDVNFIKSDGSQYGMFTPQDGTTCAVDGDNVVIHYVPKNTTIYAGFSWGTIERPRYKNKDKQPDCEVKANEDGSYDITLGKENCGKALPVAVVKNSFGKDSWTSADQYYLAIPYVAEKTAYREEGVNFIKADGSQYGMFTPQDGTTCAVEGDNVVIHYVPKNTTIYAGFNWGSVEKSIYKDDASQPEIEVKANPDGSYDITLSKDNCGYALPVAVVKNSFSKGSWTSADQYYLAVPAMSLDNAVVDSIPAQTYTGKAHKPAVSVKVGENVLVQDADYTVTYENNTNAGKAAVTVTGTGNYSGTITAAFTINAKKITPSVTLSKTVLTYTGKTQKPAVSAVYYGKTKLPASQYNAKVTAGKNVGTYNVTVTLKGNYKGTKTVSYKIAPKGAAIKAPKKLKKAFTAKWTAQKTKMSKAYVTGYQVQYATNKAFTKNVKSVTVKGYKKTSRKISGLKAKTTYYVRVRTYMKVSGKTYYSAWSAVKSVKTK